MRPVEPFGEHALGDGRRHVAHLQEPIETQIAHTLEVTRVQPRPDEHVGDERQRRGRGPLERRQADERRVGTDLGIDLRAEPAERFVQRERIEVAAPFVEEVAGNRREPGTVGGVERGPRAHEHQHRQERHFPMNGGPGVQAVGQTAAANLRKRKRGLGTRQGQARSVDRHQDTETG